MPKNERKMGSNINTTIHFFINFYLEMSGSGGGIFDFVIWLNICKHIKKLNTFINLSLCSKMLFEATRLGAAGVPCWNLSDINLLNKMLTSKYKGGVNSIAIPDLSYYTACVMAGMKITSLNLSTGKDKFVLKKGQLLNDGIELEGLKIASPGQDIAISFLPPKLKRLVIHSPDSDMRRPLILLHTDLPKTVECLRLFCPMMYVAGAPWVALPSHVTEFAFIDKFAIRDCLAIHNDIVKLMIRGEDKHRQYNAPAMIDSVDNVFPKLEWLTFANTLPLKDVPSNRRLYLHNVPNLRVLITNHMNFFNDCGLNLVKGEAQDDDTTYYKFGTKNTNNKRIKI